MVLAAIGQMTSTKSLSHNLTQVQTLVRKALASSAKVLFLPEASDYIASSPKEGLSLCQDTTFIRGVQQEARDNKLPICVGVHEPTSDGKKVKNMLLWVDEKGDITQRYQKLHMFDYTPEGGQPMKESDTTEPGNKFIEPFDTPIGKLGLAICFDLRFPEMALHLTRKGAQILTYPAAWAATTGPPHWPSLLRARAIESQCWVIAAAQVGAHNEKRTSYGHGMIIDPWGVVRAELGGAEVAFEPEVAVVDIELGLVDKVRQQIPMDRRTDVYSEV